MNTSIYGNYADTVRNELRNGKRRGSFEKGMSDSLGFQGISGINESAVFMNAAKDEALFNSLQSLLVTSGKAKYHLKPGAHPDFQHIKTQNAQEQHYITSMFIDIKNSTGLFRKYAPIAVANITTTIQRAAIHTCWLFDGYIQRYHGDGLLVYFGGKTSDLKTSVSNALKAGSFFTYFVKNDLNRIFFEEGVEDIYTRIGIDAGKDEDVLWHMAGMGECSEITTCSLHTSLAAKMQSNAGSNGIMVGDNVKDNSLLITDLFYVEDNAKRYIFQIPEEQYHYTQWKFKWENYLKLMPNVMIDANGVLSIVASQPSSQANIPYLKSQIADYRPHSND